MLDGFRLARFIQDGDAIDCFGPMYILQLILRIILVFSETLFMTKNHKVGVHFSPLIKFKFFSGKVIEKYKKPKLIMPVIKEFILRLRNICFICHSVDCLELSERLVEIWIWSLNSHKSVHVDCNNNH